MFWGIRPEGLGLGGLGLGFRVRRFWPVFEEPHRRRLY